MHLRREFSEEFRGNGKCNESDSEPYESEDLRKSVEVEPQDGADDRSYDRADQELDDAAAASVVSLDEVMGDNRDVYHHESEQCAEVYE